MDGRNDITTVSCNIVTTFRILTNASDRKYESKIIETLEAFTASLHRSPDFFISIFSFLLSLAGCICLAKNWGVYLEFCVWQKISYIFNIFLSFSFSSYFLILIYCFLSLFICWFLRLVTSFHFFLSDSSDIPGCPSKCTSVNNLSWGFIRQLWPYVRSSWIVSVCPSVSGFLTYIRFHWLAAASIVRNKPTNSCSYICSCSCSYCCSSLRCPSFFFFFFLFFFHVNAN